MVALISPQLPMQSLPFLRQMLHGDSSNCWTAGRPAGADGADGEDGASGGLSERRLPQSR